MQSWNVIIELAISTYCILFLLGTFPPKDEITTMTTIHVTVVTVAADLVSNFEFVTAFGILLKKTDKRISGIHVTVLASINNMCSFLHKVYVFKLIDAFGIYYPQVGLAAMGLVAWVLLRSSLIGLQDKNVKTWYVSDSVIAKRKTD